MGCLKLKYSYESDSYLRTSLELLHSNNDYYPKREVSKKVPQNHLKIIGKNLRQDYRYAFNGMEQDNNVSGNGNSYTTQFRQYDPRLGRWKSIDPLAAKFASVSPYNGMGNNPNFYTDPLGLEPDPPKKGTEENPYESTVDQAKVLDEAAAGGVDEVYIKIGDGSGGAMYKIVLGEGGEWVVFSRFTEDGDWSNTGMTHTSPIAKSESNSSDVATPSAEPAVESNTIDEAASTPDTQAPPNTPESQKVDDSGESTFRDILALSALANTAADINIDEIWKNRTIYNPKGALPAGGITVKTPVGLVDISSEAMTKAKNITKIGGVGFGIVGIGLTVMDIAEGKADLIGLGGADIAMGIIGMIPGPGTTISLVYFSARFIMDHAGAFGFKPVFYAPPPENNDLRDTTDPAKLGIGSPN